MCKDGSLNKIMAILFKAPDKVNFVNANKETGLIAACRSGRVDIAQYLIENGADIEAKDKKGYTPLFIAVENQKPDIVKLLIEKGANVKIKTKFLVTLLIIASKKGNIDIIKMLVQAGADLNDIDKNNETALSVAKSYEVRKFLQDSGAK